MIVLFKKLIPSAVVPVKSTQGSAGFDLVATSKNAPWGSQPDCWPNVEYGTGLAVEIPYGHVGLIFPRSSIHKKRMTLTNSVGVIDSDYRGEIKFFFKSEAGNRVEREYEVGERIGQLVIMPIPEVKFVEVSELSETKRGDGGFGSTGV